MNDDELLTTGEVATALGVSGARVRQYILAGDLPATKRGRDLMVRRGDLAAFVRPRLGRPPRTQGGDARR